MLARQSSELPAMTLNMMVPSIPSGVSKRVLLKEDLQQIGCQSLMERPWCLKAKKMVAKLLITKANEWENMLRQELKRWTSSVWWKVYQFLRGREGFAS